MKITNSSLDELKERIKRRTSLARKYKMLSVLPEPNEEGLTLMREIREEAKQDQLLGTLLSMIDKQLGKDS